MKTRFVKKAMLLMMGALTCTIPMIGYYPVTISYYGGLCSMSHISIIGFVMYTLFLERYSGPMVAFKYGLVMMATGICIWLYKKMNSKYNSFAAGFINTIVILAMELTDWYLSGQVKVELYALIPIGMLVWSATVIFTYLFDKFVNGWSNKSEYILKLKREQMLKNQVMVQASQAFRCMANNIRQMSLLESDPTINPDGTIEQVANNEMCNGCENGQLQYLERARLNYLWYNKMLETRTAMAIQFRELASIIENYTKPIPTSNPVIMGAEDYMARRLKKHRILARKIVINENNKDRIEVSVVAKTKRKTDIYISVMEKVISRCVGKEMRIKDESVVLVANEYEEYVFCEKENFITISSAAKQTRMDQDISGDNYSYINLNTGQTFMSICDGMGSGVKAGRYSEQIIDLLEHLLQSGFCEKTALKIVNSIMVTGNKNQEPAAVDMALIDRYSGMCQLLKLGAACTYIKRGNWVECIRSTSLPLGIFEQPDIENTAKKLYDGDFIIMISDGIVDSLNCSNKEETMGEIIMNIETSSPREMAWQILTKSLELSDGIPKDDMTVLCTGLWKAIG